jgi:hypothetical protein
MAKDIKQINKNLEIFNKEYEKCISNGDIIGEAKIKSAITTLMNEKRNIIKSKVKSGKVDINFDENGLIINGEKTKEKIENNLFDLEISYNSEKNEEKRIDIEKNIISLKQDLKRVNNAIEFKKIKKEKENKRKSIESKIESLTLKINDMVYSKQNSREKINILKNIEEELNYLYESTIDFDEKLNENISLAIMSINKYLNVLYSKILPKKKKIIPEKIKNFKIVFDASTGIYKFEYQRYDNDKYIQEASLYSIDKTVLANSNNILDKYIKKGYDTSNLDINLLGNLNEFDKKYKTNYENEYLENNLNYEIVYDLRKFSSNLSFEEKNKVKKIANSQKKNRNAKIVKSPISKIASAALITGLAGTLILSPHISKAKKQNDLIDLNGKKESILNKTLIIPKSELYNR